MGNISNLLIAMVVISVAATGISLFIGDMNSAYSLNAGNVSTINVMTDITQDQEQIWNTTSSGTAQTIGDLPYGIVAGGYSAITMVFDSITLFDTMLGDISTLLFGVPVVFLFSGLSLIVAIIVMFTILSAIFKWEL